jgi:hypothetical protein
MIDVIVAHYNSFDFEQFVEHFRANIGYESNVLVYDKSNKYMNKNNYNVFPRENIGREADTYLNHIITNYDKLSEYTLFIQDDTDNHIIDNGSFTKQCNAVVRANEKFKLFETSWRKGGPVHIRTITNGILHLGTFPSSDSIKLTCEKFNIALPRTYNTETCAFFVCHRDIITSRPKAFYIQLHAWVLENVANEFVLEHMWKLIFPAA